MVRCWPCDDAKYRIIGPRNFVPGIESESDHPC